MKLADPRRGNKVLDFGCGTGNLTIHLAELVGSEGRVVGVDPDGERLSLAREKYSASNLEYVQGSLDEIPGEEYDIIFSNHAMHYAVDKNAVLKTFAAKIKKGGKLVFIAEVEDELTRFVKNKPGLYSNKFRDAWATAYHYTPAEDYKQFTMGSGFVIDHSEIIVCRYNYKDVEELVEFNKTHTRGDFDNSEFNLEAMRLAYGNGPFHHDYDYILVQATYK